LPVSYESLPGCRACPRLAAHLAQLRETHPDYHCHPVGVWGARRSKLLIVGLAPGLHGANRTGQPFTGDASGTFLFSALAKHDPDPAAARLCNVRITNAVKCLPPGNRPTTSELKQCASYLRCEIDELWTEQARKPRCILALGGLAHRALGFALREVVGSRLPAFRHGQLAPLKPNLWLADSYHPSRLNTNTGRLTTEMFDSVVARVAGLTAA
jgi:uracil-DNA glycosylase family 4